MSPILMRQQFFLLSFLIKISDGRNVRWLRSALQTKMSCIWVDNSTDLEDHVTIDCESQCNNSNTHCANWKCLEYQANCGSNNANCILDNLPSGVACSWQCFTDEGPVPCDKVIRGDKCTEVWHHSVVSEDALVDCYATQYQCLNENVECSYPSCLQFQQMCQNSEVSCFSSLLSPGTKCNWKCVSHAGAPRSCFDTVLPNEEMCTLVNRDDEIKQDARVQCSATRDKCEDYGQVYCNYSSCMLFEEQCGNNKAECMVKQLPPGVWCNWFCIDSNSTPTNCHSEDAVETTTLPTTTTETTTTTIVTTQTTVTTTTKATTTTTVTTTLPATTTVTTTLPATTTVTTTFPTTTLPATTTVTTTLQKTTTIVTTDTTIATTLSITKTTTTQPITQTTTTTTSVTPFRYPSEIVLTAAVMSLLGGLVGFLAFQSSFFFGGPTVLPSQATTVPSRPTGWDIPLPDNFDPGNVAPGPDLGHEPATGPGETHGNGAGEGSNQNEFPGTNQNDRNTKDVGEAAEEFFNELNNESEFDNAPQLTRAERSLAKTYKVLDFVSGL